jgi:hypothetical protein
VSSSSPPWPLRFTPLVGEPKEKRLLAFDVEGRGGPDGFVCGAIAGAYAAEFYTERSAMWESLLSHAAGGEWVFAHNLEYDLPIVAGEEVFDGELLFKGSGLLWGTYHRGGRRARFYDSGNLFPRWSVARMGEMVGRDKLEGPPGLVEQLGSRLGWEDLGDPERVLLERYCRRDADIVYRAVAALQELLLSLGGQLAPTISGCAMDLYRRAHLRYEWPAVGEETNRLCRPAFYGGRTENFAFGKVEGVNVYDANSLYPAIQSAGRFPHPSHLRLWEGASAWPVLGRAEGVAQGVVEVGDCDVPPLPARLGSRLYFPVGELEGRWTLAELRAAEARGAAILRLDWILGSEKTFNPFESFVEDLWRRRQGSLVSAPQEAALLKLLLNSLYGRFGLDPDQGLMRLVRLSDDWRWEDLKGFRTSAWNGQELAYGPVASRRAPAYVNVLLAAQTAALARLHLLLGLESQGSALVYCDTDSILTQGRLPAGDGLGEWRLQAEDVTADLLAPKEYVLHNKTMGEEFIVKGVPARLAQQYLETGAARFKRALGVREAIAQGRNPSEWVEVLREARPTLPKRQPALAPWDQVGDYCLTLPWEYRELVKLHSAPSRWSLVRSAARRPEHHPEWERRLAAELRVPVELLRERADLA